MFDVIEAERHRLQEVAGIGPKRADCIAAGWADQRAIREIMIFLHANGVGTSRVGPVGGRPIRWMASWSTTTVNLDG